MRMEMLKYEVNHLDEAAVRAARARWDVVAKPLRSLGKLEDMIAQIAGIQGAANVRLTPRCVFVFCADHGVVAEGVSQSGQEVTALVARSIAAGGANINRWRKRRAQTCSPWTWAWRQTWRIPASFAGKWHTARATWPWNRR